MENRKHEFGDTVRAGEWVETPRFCTVQIEEEFDDVIAAYKAGYKEPTYWRDPNGAQKILGKVLDCYHMTFAVVQVV